MTATCSNCGAPYEELTPRKIPAHRVHTLYDGTVVHTVDVAQDTWVPHAEVCSARAVAPR